MKLTRHFQVVILLIMMGFASTVVADDISFARDVRPILSGRCYKCHGPDKDTLEAGLRLDDAQSATKELESGETAIVPGNLDESELIARITTDDEFLRMPPTDQGAGLNQKEIAILKQWIESGAKYEKHWSFVPPQRSAPPEVGSPNWCRNGIDQFVLKRLEAESLAPAEEADRRTLIRRVSLDLTGLPPTPEEIAEFLGDTSENAYEKLVDRLLASPAFGERWARIWLDLARYADSAGYADDPPRVIWKYRDWVIDAINEDLPLDQFTVEQLAGDLLPDPTDEQLIATAFHRNTMTNSEGGTDDEEFRNAAIVDRVNTTLQVWMGLTMGCAQCHSHKYDPISQAEFYNVFAVFNQTEDADRRDESPLFEFWTPELNQRKENLQTKIAKLKADFEILNKETGTSTPTIEIPEGPVQARFVRIDLPGKSEFLSLAEVQAFSDGKNVAQGKTATQSSEDYNGPAKLAVDGNTNGHFFDAMSTTHSKKENSPWWLVDLGKTQQLQSISVWNRNDSPGIGDRLNGFRVVLLDEKQQPVWAKTGLKANEQETVIKVPASGAEISADERTAIAEFAGQKNPEVDALKKQIADTEKQLAGIKPITVPIMRELPADKARKTHIQIRGNFLDLGDEVGPGALREFHPISAESPNRLDFAKWLVDGNNPLTARVFANRYWSILFGIGLVETSEDFGMQGELPSHPELLDWLAIQLMEQGWSRKEFLKLVVMSATYRQSSKVSSELVSVDPKNRLLARGPRFRLSAEMIRDQALAISGLLSKKMKGPSVNPPRPQLGLRAAFGGSTDWETSQGEDKYRRGIYTTWRRSMPYPSMDAFDAPSREVCTLRRIRTNTPLQALVTLNDPVYIEAAQALSGRILTEGGTDLSDKLTYGFVLCTAREPNADEREVLAQTYNELQNRFQKSPDAAHKFAAIGLPAESEISIEEQAAWSVFANVLLNLDETLTLR